MLNWLRFADHRPTDGQLCLIYAPRGRRFSEIELLMVATWTELSGWWPVASGDRVTHWMPALGPPAEGKP